MSDYTPTTEEVNKLAVEINTVLRGHYPTRGMSVASGVTCKCGYWTGTEVAGKTRPAGVSGDQLDWHRASLVAELIESGAYQGRDQ